MHAAQSGDIGYGYDEKGSRSGLLEREQERYETQSRAPVPVTSRENDRGRASQEVRKKSESGRGREGQDDGRRREVVNEKSNKARGGPTIKRGDVPMEEMGEFFAEVSRYDRSRRTSVLTT